MIFAKGEIKVKIIQKINKKNYVCEKEIVQNPKLLQNFSLQFLKNNEKKLGINFEKHTNTGYCFC